VEIKLSRHAKNKMRLHGLSSRDIEEAMMCGDRLNQGEKWESRHGKLRVVWLMVGHYAFVITVIKSR